jgi:hypothetical protein
MAFPGPYPAFHGERHPAPKASARRQESRSGSRNACGRDGTRSLAAAASNRRQNGAKRSSYEPHPVAGRSRLLLVFLWSYVWRDLIRWVCELSVNQEVAGSRPAQGANLFS